MFSLTGMPVLVTGATGTVGRHLATQLADAGHAVRALSRSPEKAALPAGIEVVGGDLDDPAALVPAGWPGRSSGPSSSCRTCSSGGRGVRERAVVHAPFVDEPGIGREIELIEQTEAELVAQNLEQGWSAADIDWYLDMVHNPPEFARVVQPTVAEVTGRPGRTFAQWVAEHAEAFGRRP